MIRITELAREQIARVLQKGETAVDATAGKGRDTLFLAELVGPEGHVHAFDIQPAALRQTASLLGQNELSSRVTLIPAGHETMAAHVGGPVAAVMFNLGYLPGGDRRIVTTPERTRCGLEAALGLLRRGGLITVVLYPGHPGGEAERGVLLDLCRNLDSGTFGVVRVELLNRGGPPPELLAVKRLQDAGPGGADDRRKML